MTQRYSISLATVVMLVLLRLNVGWHFFSEGINHYVDPQWTSEPVLRAAKGPLAPMYQAYLPDGYRIDQWLHSDRRDADDEVVKKWIGEVEDDWARYGDRFIGEHKPSDGAKADEAAVTVKAHRGLLRRWEGAIKDDLATHVHEWRRNQAARRAPSHDIPYQQARIAAQESMLRAETAAWNAELEGLENAYHTALSALVNEDQRGGSPLTRRPMSSIDVVDLVMTYVILAIGALLLLGLFTRTACVAGAVFLMSVVMTQPFWVSEAAPTFNQYVEMFTLLTLATTSVGRWAGLDFFVHRLLAGAWSSKGNSHVPEA